MPLAFLRSFLIAGLGFTTLLFAQPSLRELQDSDEKRYSDYFKQLIEDENPLFGNSLNALYKKNWGGVLTKGANKTFSALTYLAAKKKIEMQINDRSLDILQHDSEVEFLRQQLISILNYKGTEINLEEKPLTYQEASQKAESDPKVMAARQEAEFAKQKVSSLLKKVNEEKKLNKKWRRNNQLSEAMDNELAARNAIDSIKEARILAIMSMDQDKKQRKTTKPEKDNPERFKKMAKLLEEFSFQVGRCLMTRLPPDTYLGHLSPSSTATANQFLKDSKHQYSIDIDTSGDFGFLIHNSGQKAYIESNSLINRTLITANASGPFSKEHVTQNILIRIAEIAAQAKSIIHSGPAGQLSLDETIKANAKALTKENLAERNQLALFERFTISASKTRFGIELPPEALYKLADNLDFYDHRDELAKARNAPDALTAIQAFDPQDTNKAQTRHYGHTETNELHGRTFRYRPDSPNQIRELKSDGTGNVLLAQQNSRKNLDNTAFYFPDEDALTFKRAQPLSLNYPTPIAKHEIRLMDYNRSSAAFSPSHLAGKSVLLIPTPPNHQPSRFKLYRAEEYYNFQWQENVWTNKEELVEGKDYTVKYDPQSSSTYVEFTQDEKSTAAFKYDVAFTARNKSNPDLKLKITLSPEGIHKLKNEWMKAGLRKLSFALNEKEFNSKKPLEIEDLINVIRENCSEREVGSIFGSGLPSDIFRRHGGGSNAEEVNSFGDFKNILSNGHLYASESKLAFLTQLSLQIALSDQPSVKAKIRRSLQVRNSYLQDFTRSNVVIELNGKPCILVKTSRSSLSDPGFGRVIDAKFHLSQEMFQEHETFGQQKKPNRNAKRQSNSTQQNDDNKPKLFRSNSDVSVFSITHKTEESFFGKKEMPLLRVNNTGWAMQSYLLPSMDKDFLASHKVWKPQATASEAQYMIEPNDNLNPTRLFGSESIEGLEGNYLKVPTVINSELVDFKLYQREPNNAKQLGYGKLLEYGSDYEILHDPKRSSTVVKLLNPSITADTPLLYESAFKATKRNTPQSPIKLNRTRANELLEIWKTNGFIAHAKSLSNLLAKTKGDLNLEDFKKVVIAGNDYASDPKNGFERENVKHKSREWKDLASHVDPKSGLLCAQCTGFSQFSTMSLNFLLEGTGLQARIREEWVQVSNTIGGTPHATVSLEENGIHLQTFETSYGRFKLSSLAQLTNLKDMGRKLFNPENWENIGPNWLQNLIRKINAEKSEQENEKSHKNPSANDKDTLTDSDPKKHTANEESNITNNQPAPSEAPPIENDELVRKLLDKHLNELIPFAEKISQEINEFESLLEKEETKLQNQLRTERAKGKNSPNRSFIKEFKDWLILADDKHPIKKIFLINENLEAFMRGQISWDEHLKMLKRFSNIPIRNYEEYEEALRSTLKEQESFILKARQYTLKQNPLKDDFGATLLRNDDFYFQLSQLIKTSAALPQAFNKNSVATIIQQNGLLPHDLESSLNETNKKAVKEASQLRSFTPKANCRERLIIKRK